MTVDSQQTDTGKRLKKTKLGTSRMYEKSQHLTERLDRIDLNKESVYSDDRNYENCENVFFHISCAK